MLYIAAVPFCVTPAIVPLQVQRCFHCLQFPVVSTACEDMWQRLAHTGLQHGSGGLNPGPYPGLTGPSNQHPGFLHVPSPWQHVAPVLQGMHNFHAQQMPQTVSSPVKAEPLEGSLGGQRGSGNIVVDHTANRTAQEGTGDAAVNGSHATKHSSGRHLGTSVQQRGDGAAQSHNSTRPSDAHASHGAQAGHMGNPTLPPHVFYHPGMAGHPFDHGLPPPLALLQQSQHLQAQHLLPGLLPHQHPSALLPPVVDMAGRQADMHPGADGHATLLRTNSDAGSGSRSQPVSRVNGGTGRGAGNQLPSQLPPALANLLQQVLQQQLSAAQASKPAPFQPVNPNTQAAYNQQLQHALNLLLQASMANANGQFGAVFPSLSAPGGLAHPQFSRGVGSVFGVPPHGGLPNQGSALDAAAQRDSHHGDSNAAMCEAGSPAVAEDCMTPACVGCNAGSWVMGTNSDGLPRGVGSSNGARGGATAGLATASTRGRSGSNGVRPPPHAHHHQRPHRASSPQPADADGSQCLRPNTMQMDHVDAAAGSSEQRAGDAVHPAASVHATVIVEGNSDADSEHSSTRSGASQPSNGAIGDAEIVSQPCGASHSASPAPSASVLAAATAKGAMSMSTVLASGMPRPVHDGPHDSSMAMATAGPSTRSGGVSINSGTVDMSIHNESQKSGAGRQERAVDDEDDDEALYATNSRDGEARGESPGAFVGATSAIAQQQVCCEAA